MVNIEASLCYGQIHKGFYMQIFAKISDHYAMSIFLEIIDVWLTFSDF